MMNAVLQFAAKVNNKEVQSEKFKELKSIHKNVNISIFLIQLKIDLYLIMQTWIVPHCFNGNITFIGR